MIHNLSLVHVLLALAAAATIYLVMRENRRTYVSQWRLFAPGIAGSFVAAVLFLTQIGAGEPRWLFVAAAVAGLVIGAVRGGMIGLQHDRYNPEIVIAHRAGLVYLAVSFGVAICAALEIIGAYASPDLEKLRFWAALSAMVLAMAMLSRALALTIRFHRNS
ncbi:hypothetical protein BH11PSE3_BH11PSE3_47670 [soil metagenome]